ncbi:hypothetical protein [Candidatus Chromulinivorax destructor]|uniref:Uncharacterized protein n=1 Tax=Candidatus Chromulinivorax destructor TaxID=2066483 RepID=A0A345ZAS0_9BACT|nr:hypothetical protein [Candidatus Chromulinivorax destructor]AXK60387.1 hypothetical protein C0J27_01305 [Candidatus Chromulinivorax destructor]
MKRSKFYNNMYCSIIFLSIPGEILSYSDYDKNFSASKQAEIVISIATAGIMSAAIYQYCSTLPGQKDLLVMEEKYPYVQAWYNYLIKKYPQVHFDTKQLLRGSYARDEYEGWKSSFNQIYCPSTILVNINDFYKKKINGQALTNEELLFLDVQEFMILCQAGTIEYNHMIQKYLYTFGVIIGLEAIRVLYKEFTDESAKKYYSSQKTLKVDSNSRSLISTWDDVVHAKMDERNGNIFGCELVAAYILSSTIFIFQKPQEYEFACRYADIDILERTVLFFEAFVNRKEDHSNDIKTPWAIYYSSTVSQWYYDICRDPKESGPSTRASIIHNEIERRKKLGN